MLQLLDINDCVITGERQNYASDSNIFQSSYCEWMTFKSLKIISTSVLLLNSDLCNIEYFCPFLEYAMLCSARKDYGFIFYLIF